MGRQSRAGTSPQVFNVSCQFRPRICVRHGRLRGIEVIFKLGESAKKQETSVSMVLIFTDYGEIYLLLMHNARHK